VKGNSMRAVDGRTLDGDTKGWQFYGPCVTSVTPGTWWDDVGRQQIKSRPPCCTMSEFQQFIIHW